MKSEHSAAPISGHALAPAPTRPVTAADRRPTLGVIISAYQAAATIGEAVESVLAQTHPADEIVICDDGSTDELEGALAQYGDRVVLIRKENGGSPSALNVAARAARSEFVVLLDADDAFAPTRLEAIADLAVARPDLDLIATDAVMELNGKPVSTYRERHGFDVHNQRAAILRSCFFGWPAIRRIRLLAIGGFDEALQVNYDWDCEIRLILSGSAVGLIDRPLYTYRMGHTSLSSDPARNCRENIVMLKKLLDGGLLAPQEQRIAIEVIEQNDRGAAALKAMQAVVTGQPEARRLMRSVATGTGFSLSMRAKAALAALAPGVARRYLARGDSTLAIGSVDPTDR